MRDTLLLLSINLVPGLRWYEKEALADRLSSSAEFLALRPIDIAREVGRAPRNTLWNPRDILDDAQAILERTAKRGIEILSYNDPSYPPQLREIYDPPFLLFSRGKLPSWDRAFLGIVGTRSPSGAGRKAAYESAYIAAERGFGVVSGLARGIDGEAHRGALDGKGYTIAVLGNGADTVYPRSHRFLAGRVLDQGGLLLTEYAPGTEPLKFHFPARNRILSGLSRGVLVIEAPAKSGALITADYALEQGRDLFVHADCLGLSSGAGCAKLAEDGAVVVKKLDDILADWYLAPRLPTGHISSERTDELCFEESFAHPGILLARRLEEELAGKTVLHGGNYFRRTDNG
jgi:DNA processing protein